MAYVESSCFCAQWGLCGEIRASHPALPRLVTCVSVLFLHCPVVRGPCRWPCCSSQSNLNWPEVIEAAATCFLTSKRWAWVWVNEIKYLVLRHFFLLVWSVCFKDNFVSSLFCPLSMKRMDALSGQWYHLSPVLVLLVICWTVQCASPNLQSVLMPPFFYERPVWDSRWA